MEYIFSDRISKLQPSAIREIFKSLTDPEIVAFAAGNPAPDAFPVNQVREIAADVFKNRPIDALQYGITEGYGPLRKKVTAYMKEKYDIGRELDDIIITSGAQQVMDLSSKCLLNEGDCVICEFPSFIGSLNCFRSYNAVLKGVKVDDDGMNIEELEKVLKETKKVKFIYTIPNFQNPSGVTMSLEKRKALYELARKYGVLILEDNPYGDLRVEGENIPSIKSMDEDGIVIYAGTFSKILAPGIRVGYVIAPSKLISKMAVGKQASDVHTTMFSQLVVNDWMEKYDFESHIKEIQNIYRKKINLMCDCIDEELGDFVSYVRPQGGLFIWCKLPDYVDMMEFCKEALAKKVAVVPGTAFVTNDGDKTQCIRLNFSTPTDENIVKGMKILGEVKRKFLV